MAVFLGFSSDMSYKPVIYGGDKIANKAELIERNGRWYFSKAYLSVRSANIVWGPSIPIGD